MTDYTTPSHGTAGSEYFQSEGAAGPIHLPSHSLDGDMDDSAALDHMARAMAMRPSMDIRLREALRPEINDLSVLKPEKYRALLMETHAALVQQHHGEADGEDKSALADLISLLEENFSLTALLDQYANAVHKA